MKYTTPPEIAQICEISAKYSTKIKPSERAKITSSKDGERILRTWYESTGMIEQKEIFCAMLLNRVNKVLGIVKVSEGSATATIVDVQYILRLALLTGAQTLVLCHNHPSGNCKPSQEDLTMTKKVKEAAKLMDIHLLDHVILTTESYYSFADEGGI
jgi:DNA repair protein RadC